MTVVTKIGLYKDPRKKRPWIVRWFGEMDFAAAKKKRYCKAFEQKRDALAFQAQKLTEFESGQQRDLPKDITLHDFCKDWLKVRNRELRSTSLELYENSIMRLKAYFGETALLRHITTLEASKFIASLKRYDNKKGELSSWSRHRVIRNCATLFNTAVEWSLLKQNPFSKVKKPKLITRPWYYLKPAEYRKLLEVAPLRCRVIYALAYGCGLRLGEILSLQWSDVGFDTNQVMVENHASTQTNPPFNVKDYESRAIPLPEHVSAILSDLRAYNDMTETVPYIAHNDGQYRTLLDKWQRYQKEGREWKNQDWQNNTLVKFKRHLRWAGIEPKGTLSIHTLRKCCITNWANEINNPEVVRRLAGHSDLATKMKYYCAVTKEQRTRAAQAIDALMEKSDAEVTP